MVEKVTFTIPKLNDDGSQQWAKINTIFENVFTVLNEHADELKALARHNTSTISFAIQNDRPTVILHGGKHFRGKITNAYVIMGDSAPEDVNVWLTDGKKKISETVYFTKTEKTGKVKIFKLLRDHLHFLDEVVVEQTGKRRLIINLTLESAEEQHG